MNPEKPKSDAEQPAGILVVDDTPANLQVLAGMLKDRGYKVRPVPSGKLALLAARSPGPDPAGHQYAGDERLFGIAHAAEPPRNGLAPGIES